MQRESGSASISNCIARQSAGVMATMRPPASSEPLLTATLTSVSRCPRSSRYSMVTTRMCSLLSEAAVQKATCVAML